jgi:hypothetical protein
MKSRLLWCLIGINIALLAIYFVPRQLQNTAIAQVPGGRPAEYLMLPGEIGGGRGVAYLIDTSNGMLSAMAFNEATGRVEIMPPTDLVRVFQEGVDAPRRR